jgi:uncharacterized protein YoxC
VILDIALWVVALVCICVVHYRTKRSLSERLYQRQVVMDKQHKVLRRDVARLTKQADEALERSKSHHQSVKDLHRKVDRTLRERSG